MFKRYSNSKRVFFWEINVTIYCRQGEIETNDG